MDKQPDTSVFTLSAENQQRLEKLQINLAALNKPSVDINEIVNDGLGKTLARLLAENKHPTETQEYLNQDRLHNPRVGDSWAERCIGYLTVMHVHNSDDVVVYTFVKFGDHDKGVYRINRNWLARMVLYANKIPTDRPLKNSDFCADLTWYDGKHIAEATEWYSQLDKTLIVDLRNEVPA